MAPRVSARSNPMKKESIKREPIELHEEDINASQQSTSDEEDSVDIKPSVFRKGSEQSEETAKGSRAGFARNKARNPSVSGKDARNTHNVKAVGSPSSISGPSAPKRKNGVLEDKFKSSWGDPFGRPKKVRVTYGSSQRNQASSQLAPALSKTVRHSPTSPKGSTCFVIPDVINSPMSSQDTNPGFWRPDDPDDSPLKPSTQAKSKITKPAALEHTPLTTPGAEKSFRNLVEADSQAKSDLYVGGSLSDLDDFARTLSSSPTPNIQTLVQSYTNGFAKRDPMELLKLKKNDLGGDLASKVQNIIGQDGDDLGGEDSMDFFDNDLANSTVIDARCPMCRQPCDAAELRKWGAMDTRKQERFCRFHRKTTAKKNWSSKGYPEIHWDKLDSRILEHHEFIKGLLNGADSHYRKAFEGMVAAGKGRSLRKLESNLTPGYYGSRGLNTISEFVIREFSRLLSKRSVKDPLISKRGTTAFVQSVIVPEVAVRLIVEDLSINDVEARDVLTESANMGELVNEEIRDVVIEKVENSDDDEDEE